MDVKENSKIATHAVSPPYCFDYHNRISYMLSCIFFFLQSEYVFAIRLPAIQFQTNLNMVAIWR